MLLDKLLLDKLLLDKLLLDKLLLDKLLLDKLLLDKLLLDKLLSKYWLGQSKEEHCGLALATFDTCASFTAATFATGWKKLTVAKIIKIFFCNQEPILRYNANVVKIYIATNSIPRF
jgi:hypothetical protein